MVFVIDELDRCTPTFALSILETIKHLFAVPGVVFVLVTNTQQLEAAIHGAYGQDIDANEYLEKFFELRVRLPAPQTSTTPKQKLFVDHIWKALELPASAADIRDVWTEFAIAKRLELRRIERISSEIAVQCAALNATSRTLPHIFVGLCVLKHIEPELYRRFGNGDLAWGEKIGRFFSDASPRSKRGWEIIEDVWRYCVTNQEGGNPHTIVHVRNSLAGWPLDDVREFIPLVVKRMEEIQFRQE